MGMVTLECAEQLNKAGMLSDYDIKESIKNNEIVICPFNKEKLTPLGYNLSFTKFILSTKNKLLYKIQTDKKTHELYCIVEPNDTILILTQEAVWVSEKMAGTFHSKVGIVSKGFGHISTTLDPNWEGPLLISLNNPTKQKIKLVIGKDGEDGIKYKTFVTLIFYRMVSKAEGIQDNLPCRIEILKDTKDSLKDSKKYFQLISIIDEIRNFETFQVGIGATEGKERKDKIKQFEYKYSKFAIELNNNISKASEISKSIVDCNYIKYIVIMFVLIVLFIILIIIALKAYITHNSSLLSLIAIFVAIYIFISGLIEKYSRKKLL